MGKTSHIFTSGGKYRREKGRIARIGGKLPKILKKKGLEFEAYLVSNREIKVLNRKFLGKDRPTNVLSFEAGADSVRPDLKKNARYLGEIFLAPDYIRSRGENLEHLFIHGFLHLLGYTHSGRRDTIKMEKMEKKLSQRPKI